MSDEPKDEFVGPPRVKHPWEEYPDRVVHYDRALEIASMAKNFREAGHMAANAQTAAQHSADLAQHGGLTPEEATNISRYRMWKLGMQNIPTGERAQAPTPEEISARREAYFKADKEGRARMWDEDKQAVDRSHEAFFDSLVGKRPPESPNVTPQKIDAARNVVARARQRGPVS